MLQYKMKGGYKVNKLFEFLYFLFNLVKRNPAEGFISVILDAAIDSLP